MSLHAGKHSCTGHVFFFVLHIVKCSLHVQTFELMVDLIGSDD